MEGKRHNAGKLRYDLIPATAEREYAKVLTAGAEKYGDRNWEHGMAWSKVLASLERHLQAIKRGEDYDPETGLLHSAHVMCNAAFLTEYYFTHPGLDDRKLPQKRRIGLDIDDVIADWIGSWCAYFKKPIPRSWQFHRGIESELDRMRDNKDFWMGITPCTEHKEWGFEPVVYITARPVPDGWTEEWLDKHGFPAAPVVNVGLGGSKVIAAQQFKLDLFVDDRFEYFQDLNHAGVPCLLFDAHHNQRYNVGPKRIYDLNQVR